MGSLSCIFSMSPPPQLLSSSPHLSSIPTRALPLASSTTSSPQRKTLKTTSSSPKPFKPSSSSSPSAQTLSTPNTLQNPSASTKKVLVPIGFGTEEMEAVVLIDVMRRAGADVTVASVEPQLQIEASGGVKLVADTYISKCSTEIFDLVALPGGMPGSARLRDCEILRKITSKQAEEKRLYGAISAAPAVTLLPWGLLKRKQTTCHPAFFDKLPTFWAVKSNLQVSGELTTSRGPGTSFQFALSLAEQLFGESVAKDIAELLLMQTSNHDVKNEEFNKVEWSLDNTPHVLIPIANGCEAIEVVTIIDILRRAKIDVVVASVERSLQISASQGTKIVADKLIAEAFDDLYDLIILVGGAVGAERLQKSRILKRMLKEQHTAGRMYGAMCSSLAVLNRQGLLKDKRATMFPSTTDGSGNGVSDGAKVVIDGKVITSRGLASVTDFALAVISKLFGHGRARSVAEGLVFEYPRS